ncbi:MAG: polysaccharide deacetylase family protein [Saprospiraceae bacterium]|nr:polysaccharide deacetylase family protein [Saprospiraceae bacterium]
MKVNSSLHPLTLFVCLVFMTATACSTTESNDTEGAATDSGQEETTATWAQKLGFPADKIVLILHADDIGMCPEANVSAKHYMENDYIQSCAVMMPCPNAQDFIEWAKEHPDEDVGLHLTLTSEWKTYRWPGITSAEDAPGLLDEEGKLWHEVIQVVQNASPAEVEKEIRAQVQQAIDWGYQPDHIDTHMGTLYGSHLFTAAYLKVAEEYEIPAMVLDFENPVVVQGFKDAGYPINDQMIEIVNAYSLPKLDFFASAPNADTYAEKKASFQALVRSLQPGLTEIIFHPSELTDNLKSITNSWQQRSWEAQMFQDEDMIEFFKSEKIVFTNWKEIMKRFKAG